MFQNSKIGAIENFIDMGILLFIQFANAGVSFYEKTKADDAIEALKNTLKPKATVKRDGSMNVIDATLIVSGDCVLLAAGSTVPADCRINDGTIDVDQSQLTGESLPVTLFSGDSCKMGSTVVRGEVLGTVEFTGANTFFGTTASLLATTNELSNLQKLFAYIVGVLVIISTVLCVIVFLFLLVGKQTNLRETLSFTVVLLIASIPLASEVVSTAVLALGAEILTQEGAIVSRLTAIEDLAGKVSFKYA